MSEKKVIIGFVVVTALVLAGGIFLLTKSSTAGQVEISQNVKAEVAEKTFDWGNIPMYKGNVTKTFTIKNSGTDTLKLINEAEDIQRVALDCLEKARTTYLGVSKK